MFENQLPERKKATYDFIDYHRESIGITLLILLVAGGILENILYAVAVLASLCNDSVGNPAVVASVVRKLHEIDQRMLDVAPPNYQRCEGDWLEAEEAMLNLAKSQVARLGEIGLEVDLYYNDEMPDHAKSRLRIEIPNTSWDSDSPLYLS